MPIRSLLRFLSRNEQLISKLSESYPIRRAAQLSAFFFQRGRALGEENYERLKESETLEKAKQDVKSIGNRVESFSKTFSRELQDGFRELNKEIEKKKKSGNP